MRDPRATERALRALLRRLEDERALSYHAVREVEALLGPEDRTGIETPGTPRMETKAD